MVAHLIFALETFEWALSLSSLAPISWSKLKISFTIFFMKTSSFLEVASAHSFCCGTSIHHGRIAERVDHRRWCTDILNNSLAPGSHMIRQTVRM